MSHPATFSPAEMAFYACLTQACDRLAVLVDARETSPGAVRAIQGLVLPLVRQLETWLHPGVETLGADVRPLGVQLERAIRALCRVLACHGCQGEAFHRGLRLAATELDSLRAALELVAWRRWTLTLQAQANPWTTDWDAVVPSQAA